MAASRRKQRSEYTGIDPVRPPGSGIDAEFEQERSGTQSPYELEPP
jgi:hypothetical protein